MFCIIIRMSIMLAVGINPGFMTTCLRSFEYITHKFARPPFSFKFINILYGATVQKLICRFFWHICIFREALTFGEFRFLKKQSQIPPSFCFCMP